MESTDPTSIAKESNRPSETLPSNRKPHSSCKRLKTITFVFVLLLGVGAYLKWSWGEPPTPRPMDVRQARIDLKNMGLLQQEFSVRAGGGGEKTFASTPASLLHIDTEALKKGIADSNEILYRAFFGVEHHKSTPDGIVFKLEENPKGDGFKTNFSIKAMPAEGFTGQTLAIDKAQEIKELGKP